MSESAVMNSSETLAIRRTGHPAENGQCFNKTRRTAPDYAPILVQLHQNNVNNYRKLDINCQMNLQSHISIMLFRCKGSHSGERRPATFNDHTLSSKKVVIQFSFKNGLSLGLFVDETNTSSLNVKQQRATSHNTKSL